jgi:small nuclear ribonucleoprotein (snRNP)-like protein
MSLPESQQPSKKPAKAETKVTSATKEAAANGRHQKTLCSLLQYFEGVELSVELKTGRIYRGTLASADDYMNLALDNAIQIEPPPSRNGDPEMLISCHIRGPNIRYIHFPDYLDLGRVIRMGKDRERAAAQKYKQGTRNNRSVTTGGKAQADTEQKEAAISK